MILCGTGGQIKITQMASSRKGALDNAYTYIWTCTYVFIYICMCTYMILSEKMGRIGVNRWPVEEIAQLTMYKHIHNVRIRLYAK